MSDKRYEANIITATAVEPANNIETTSAAGVWSLDEVMELQKKDKWPTAGNVTTDVDDVFSTYLYDGTGSALTINNGLDLSGEGGLVWIKKRSGTDSHALIDTTRGVGKIISTDTAAAEFTASASITSFNSNGFTLGNYGWVNGGSTELASWTWRKAPRFFDVVTYTGNGTAGRTINHNLGSVPGMIIVKQYQAGETRPWTIYHRGVDASAPEDYRIHFTTAAAVNSSGQWNDTAPTSTQFTVGDSTYVNNNGESYVAYLFAHNNNDGEFGPSGDQDIIKCGNYTGNSSSTGPTVDLGFEPQWLMVKRTSNTGGWFVIDMMRGWTSGSTNDPFLRADSNQQEYENPYFKPLATGFQPKTTSSAINYSGDTYIYVAIRRGPLAEPTSATDVFAMDTYGGTAPTPPLFNSGFPVDMAFYKHKGNTTNFVLSSRPLQGKYLITDSTAAESTLATLKFDFQDGYFDATGTISDYVSWMWKRAPGFFDVVCHTGDGTADRAIAHNLGQVPRLRITKARQSTTYDSWWVYYIDSGGTQTRATLTQSPFYSNTDVVSTATNIYPDVSVTNASGIDYVHFLFGEISGISKISTYTGNGGTSAIDVNCGFSSGARFVLIKSTSESTNWVFYDSLRGIVSGNDPYLLLNLAQAEVTGTDYIDPLSSGFTVSTSAPTSGLVSLNANNVEYVFYAIA